MKTTAPAGRHALQIRSQADELGDVISRDTSISDFGRDMTRQEFKEETDINVLATKFNLEELKRPVNWGGEIDYTVDLQQSITTLNESRSAYNRLHPAIKEKFPTWESFIAGANDGSLADELAKVGIKNIETLATKKIDEEISAADKRSARIREREAADLADRVKKGEKFTPATEGKPKE